MRLFLRTAACAALLAALSGAAPFAAAADDTPAGLWKTIDDKTGKPKSVVRIAEVNGSYVGTVEKLFREPSEEQNPVCDQCSGDRKGKPIIGMQIMAGLKKEAEANRYSGGEILDPNNGKTYRCKLELVDGGKKLDVRGYIGVPALGRTQTWVREGQ
jgi:uncharacterized protein (DUF2147 family)